MLGGNKAKCGLQALQIKHLAWCKVICHMHIWGQECYPIFLKFIIILPYPHERGPMGGTPYTGQRLGGRPVSVLHLDVKECPGKLPTLSS